MAGQEEPCDGGTSAVTDLLLGVLPVIKSASHRSHHFTAADRTKKMGGADDGGDGGNGAQRERQSVEHCSAARVKRL